jgi:hypothetical protein
MPVLLMQHVASWPAVDASHKRFMLPPCTILQAPQALADLCMRALQQHPSSCTQYLANKSLELLFAKGHCGNKQNVSALGKDLCAAVLQQLQQAGFMQQLPALIALAAQDLTAGSNLGSSSSSSSGGGSTQMQRLYMLKATFSVWDHTNHVMSLCSSLVDIISTAGGGNTCLQHAPAALQLILTGYETLARVHNRLRPEDWRDIPEAMLMTQGIHGFLSAWVRCAHVLFWKIAKETRGALSAQPRLSAAQDVSATDSTLDLTCWAPLICTAASPL